MRTALESDLLRVIQDSSEQRSVPMASLLGCSVGELHETRRLLKEKKELDEQDRLTPAVQQEISENSPQRAVILAAGMGMRALPLSAEQPKALLEVYGEPLIERLIRQLQQAGIQEIEVVTGYRAKDLDYLAEKFGVRLIYNDSYAETNNLHSLALCSSLDNCYIVPSDLWFETTPFRRAELRSWYMTSSKPAHKYPVHVRPDCTMEQAKESGETMVGISYISHQDHEAVEERIRKAAVQPGHASDFWEDALWQPDGTFALQALPIRFDDWVEINTFEQLRQTDEESRSLSVRSMQALMDIFDCSMNDVQAVSILKKGMTNRSFLFEIQGQRYIMRLPGEGTEQLISRRQEAEVYALLQGSGICDEVVYLSPDNGYKVTKFLHNARSCDPFSEEDLVRAMDLLHRFHDLQLHSSHEFDLFAKAEEYRSFLKGAPSRYPDHEQVKERVFTLKPFLDAHAEKKVLSHIDAVPDNFLFYTDPDSDQEQLVLIDWEYAGNQDPLVDLAMFSIYAMYNQADMEHLLQLYLKKEPTPLQKARLLAYAAVCGFLWSEWCEYKAMLGVEFGAYSLAQYEYAREFSMLAWLAIESLEQETQAAAQQPEQ